MAEPATLNGRAAGKLQAALYYARKRRRAKREAGAPANTVAPSISGTPTVGQELTVSEGTWSGDPSFLYQWRRDGTVIAGADAASYTLVPEDEGALIACIVTGANGSGQRSAITEAVGPVAAA